MADTVLVTGVSGFIGGHIASELLRQGYAVRGSIRSPRRADRVREAMVRSGVDAAGLEFRLLDLLADDGWADAAAGARFVIHVASPFVTAKTDPLELIRPAEEGTRRAVEAGLAAGAERVVVTSSLATVQFAPFGPGHVLGESDWSPSSGRGINAYTTSKIRAERMAWGVADADNARERVATILPGAVIGPLLGDEVGTSVGAIRSLLTGELSLVPDLRMPWVDVRDIADAHIAAMTSGAAAGRRTIVATDPASLIDVATVLRTRLPGGTAGVPHRGMPTWMTWAASLVEPQLRDNRWLIGSRQRFDHGPTVELFGRPLRSVANAVEETARSLLDRDLVEFRGRASRS